MPFWSVIFLAALANAQNLAPPNQLILRKELDPFWYEIMIPVVLCLAVILLIVSIFAVALITVKSMQDTDSALVSFVPPGFDSAWEQNVKVELDMFNASLRDLSNSPIEVITVFPDANYSTPKLAKENLQLVIPKPLMADNLTEIPFRQK
jgi:hypothetical protein